MRKMAKLNRLFLLSFFVVLSSNYVAFCQKSNNNKNKFSINFSLPKLPNPKEFFDQFLPPSPNSWFPPSPNSWFPPSPNSWFPNPFSLFGNRGSSRGRSFEESEPEDKSEENGNWNFFGREFANRVQEVLKDLGEFTGISNITTGLDTNLENIPIVGDAVKNFQDSLRAILPGTQWCGDGDRARNFKDLGIFSKADACCRAHDKCSDYIPAGTTKYELRNTGLFTRSHCSCDEEFYDCLKDVNSVVSSQIGFTYFTILGPQCFKQDYPIVKCSKVSGGKCEEYELNTKESNETYQWFDNKRF